MSDYHINIFYSNEDDGYIADIPDLVACSVFGETAIEALREVELAEAAWIETVSQFQRRTIDQLFIRWRRNKWQFRT